MNWQKSMEQAMEYIESNLTGKIEYGTAARFMNCSEWEFRRIFSFLSQIPLSEYIRRRRLSEAAFEIREGAKIIDVSQKYGYESQASFSRAFSKLHGLSPSAARDKQAVINPYPPKTFKLVLMEGIVVEKDSNQRASIIGGKDVGFALAVENDQNKIHKTNESFWDESGNEVLGAMALPLYGAFISEEKCGLLGDIENKKVLEIGCGTGRSLQYVGERKAGELWGIDISKEQIEKSRRHLSNCNLSANLICSPMEKECGIPKGYFDLIYSVYGIGWTTDLEGTFKKIASYLKKDGVFIFSWSHPIHKCVGVDGDALSFKKCYFDESWYSVSIEGNAISLSDRKISTYINALAKAGFIVEEMIEESQEEIIQSVNSKFSEKAKMLPVTFVIKGRKK